MRARANGMVPDTHWKLVVDMNRENPLTSDVLVLARMERVRTPAANKPAPRSRVCIYCLRERPLSDYRKRDHVMPRAFGGFENSPTLDCVCDDCNGYFGRTIEREISRDSLEGLLRVYKGMKPASEAGDLRSKRSRLELNHEDPAWEGRHLVWAEGQGKPAASLVPQVGFPRRDGQGLVYVLERELADLSKPLPPEARLPGAGETLTLLSSSKEMTESLLGLLARRGISFQPTTHSEGHVVSVDGHAGVGIIGQVDENTFRYVGKIAFNYLAWRAGADFVRLESFNPIRAFVRHGTQVAYPLVRVVNEPILTTDSPDRRQTDGHLVMAMWSEDDEYLIGRVSLFNSLTYSVSLAATFQDVWRPMVTGHHFDHRSRRITMLVIARTGQGPDSAGLTNPI